MKQIKKMEHSQDQSNASYHAGNEIFYNKKL